MTPSRSRSVLLAAVTAALLALAGCGGSTGSADGSSNASSTAGSTAPTGTMSVLAAASLTEAFTTLGKDFEKANPGTTVTFSFGASSTLATQITQGAPADVFAAASPATMKTVTTAGANADDPATFVTNTLEIAVPRDNPGAVTGLRDFADADRKIALCATQVPCGAAAAKVFAAAGITPRPDTLEQDVKATLQKVSLGEVDAALVYRTDVLAAGDAVRGIEFPQASKAVNDYPVCTLRNGNNEAGGAAFVAFVRSAAGQAVLAKAGFGRP